MEMPSIEYKGVGVRKQTELLYDSILADYEVGDYGEAMLDAEDNRLTVRNRLKAAATRRGLGVEFRRTSGDLLRFKIVAHKNGNGTTAVVPAPVVAAEGRMLRIFAGQRAGGPHAWMCGCVASTSVQWPRRLRSYVTRHTGANLQNFNY
jgi:hypothetical protein